ncbi:MAG: ExbD/TolR family protein [Pseudohongiellaceae bacterium]
MKFKRSKNDELTISITPLIDVVFLLLIFFMVTTTFSRETRLLVNLPEANAELAPDTELQQIEVLVAQDGSYAINGRALVNARIDTLMRGLEIESGGDLGLPILLIADAEATHQSVVTAMDAIGQSGFTRLNIATQRPVDDAGQGDGTQADGLQ